MKKALIIAGAVFGVLLLIAVAIPLIVDANQFKPRVESEASAALGRKVTIGNLELSILRGAVVARDLQIADDAKFSSNPFVTAKELRVGAELMPLIMRRELKITGITLEEPRIALVKNAAAKWNFESLGSAPKQEAAGSAAGVSVSSIKVKDGEVSVAQGNKRNTYTNVNAEVSGFSDKARFPFELSAETPGGGEVNVEGEAGPMMAGNTMATPVDAKIKAKKLDLGKTGFVDPASGIAGTLDYEGTLKSDGAKLVSEGKATATDLKVVKSGAPARQPITVDYASELDVQQKRGTITRGDIIAGNTKAKLSGTFDTKGDAIAVNGRLKGDGMPLDGVVGLLPAFGVILPQGTNLQGGTVNADLQLQGPIDRLVTSGPINVNNTKVSGFNLKQRASGISALAGIPSGSDLLIQLLNSRLRVAPEGIRAEGLQMVVPNVGTLAGDGTIGANNSLNFKMRAKLAGGGGLLGGVSALSTLGQSKGEIPFLVQGTTSNPVFLPDVAGAITNTAKAPVQTVGGVGNVLGGIFGKKKKK